jgi:uncharacterized radical SAM superfamily Fe-S cluster-containing enzyme
MYNYHILTHRNGVEYSAPHFFILSKGNNSGRPMKNPCSNCFVCQTYSDEEANYLFWVSFFIFKNKSISKILHGSVIPFVRIKDYKKEFKKFLEKAISNKSAFFKTVEVLEKLEQYKTNMNEYLSKIDNAISTVSLLKY